MRTNSWTAADLDNLRNHYGKAPISDLVAKLNRTDKAIRSRAKLLKLGKDRRYTTTEIAFVRDNAGKMTVPQIARHLNRQERGVHQLRDRLGLSRPRLKYGDDFVAMLREKHAAGWSDNEIAAFWASKHPNHWPTERHTVGEFRIKLGLADNTLSAHRRSRVANKTREQLDRAGLPSIGHLRVEAFKKRARDAGWPENLRPRAVQILNLLWIEGPKTRREIADGIGMPWKGSRKSLVSNDPEGSYLAHLMARGLVIMFKRAHKVHGQGKGKSCNVYSLPLDIERKAI